MDSDQKYFDQVAEELAARNLNPGIWARALAESGGDEARARAAYIRLRAQELKGKDAESKKGERSILEDILLAFLVIMAGIMLGVYLVGKH
jgi:hypothetical protein